MSHIDPIAVRDERARLEEDRQAMQSGSHAADALLWFHEYGTGRKPDAVIKVSASLVAGSTPNAAAALSFVTHVTQEFAQQILDAAIEKARRQFYAAEQLRRQKKP